MAAPKAMTATEVSLSQPKKRIGTVCAFWRAKTATTLAKTNAATKSSCNSLAPFTRSFLWIRIRGATPLLEAAGPKDGQDEAHAENAGDDVPQDPKEGQIEEERTSLSLDDQGRSDDEGADDHGETDPVAHDVDPVDQAVEPPVVKGDLRFRPG